MPGCWRHDCRRRSAVRWPQPPETVTAPLDTIVDAVHRHLLSTAADDAVDLAALALRADPFLDDASLAVVIDRVRSRTTGLDRLDPLLADPTVEEVMVNGRGDVWIERHGRLECTDLTLAPSTTMALLERIVTPLGLRIDRSSPWVDARLPDGSRVNAIIPPLAVDGPLLTIRRFSARGIDLDTMAWPGVVRLLRWAVVARRNIVVSGGAGAGKTTLLNALAGAIDGDERVITIEDAAELRLPGRHVLRLEARPANAEGEGEVRIRQLVRNALRMRPDRIVVGEVRAEEALDMLQAMNTGHDGSMSTCHANSPVDALRRLEILVLMGDVALPAAAVRAHLGAAIDLVVHVARADDGSRRITEVAEPSSDGSVSMTLGAEPLTDGDGRLVRLPIRAPRRAAPPASPDWLDR
ncbi:MAG: CpaF family protein [Acidimicrobiia bacterium]|nr:CpaF family protein [Acidimicrobiia bacterium]